MSSRRDSAVKTVLPMLGARHTVHISSDGSVDNETVNVSKSDGDQIVWHADHGEAFSVYFPVSPFGFRNFDVLSGQDKPSGPVRPDAGVGYYPYYITIGKGKAVDPGVNVK